MIKIKEYIKFLKTIIDGKILYDVTKNEITSKKVLIVYTVFPFKKKRFNHSNFEESKVIAEIFHQKGYRVDVINYNSPRIPNYENYNLIFGFGEAFEKSFTVINCKAKRVYYGTGAHTVYQNIAEIRRIIAFNNKYGSNLTPKRLVPNMWPLSTSFCDLLIVIGNNWTANTYKPYTDKPIVTLNSTALTNKFSFHLNRNISEERRNFLWFGSTGLIHKGLDLCLEYFSRNMEITLHICGILEKDFFEILKGHFEKPNVHYHGFINVNSQKFIQLTSLCLFSILPSCSEGQATSLLTTMRAGLIPIATESTGIDVANFGFQLDDLSVEAIAKAINFSDEHTDEDLTTKSLRCKYYIEKEHTINRFRENLRGHLESFL